ncbi:hypothetical protein F8M41_015760 [Gigaspora margarita]|uniref:Uncharacterized protein n=1 Tax=Gigaspora margarita TaxID=4874 RepID=A0A8H3WUB3_GIGMA|nr:hypothetical protein F8M41_015760 [Gigaspora margarita]
MSLVPPFSLFFLWPSRFSCSGMSGLYLSTTILDIKKGSSELGSSMLKVLNSISPFCSLLSSSASYSESSISIFILASPLVSMFILMFVVV